MADFMYASGCEAAVPKLEDIGTQLQTQGTKLQTIRNELGKWQGYSGIGSSMDAICGELDAAKGQIGILSSTLSKIAECYHNAEQSITENGSTYRRTEDKAGKKEDTKEVEVDLDKWLESDYKLSKEEVKKAKELLDKYFVDGSTAQKMRDSNNANYIMVLRNSMSDEEYSEYQKMVALANKTSVAASITTGAFESVPFLGKIRDGLNSYIAEAEGRTVEEVSKSEYANKNSMRQHPVGTVAGFVLGSIAVQEAIEGAVGEIFSKGGSAAAYESGKYSVLGEMSEVDGVRYRDWNYEKIHEISIHNPNSDSMTLGKYFDGTIESGSYIARAELTGDTYFSLGTQWNDITQAYGLSDREMFNLFNTRALDDAVMQGKKIRFSQNPLDWSGTALGDEWSYLQHNHGYTDLIEMGGYWYAIK